MTVVKNIKVVDFNLIKEISNKKNKPMQLCVELLAKHNIDAATILPKRSKLTVSFELTNSNADIANGIRRCLIDEIPIKSFELNEHEDLESSDPYILCDVIKKQIELLPINQEYDYTDLEISLYKKNNNDEIIDVTTDALVFKTAKSDKITNIVGSGILLTRLRPGETITIKKISISIGTGKENYGKFSSVSNITYKILDAEPMIDTRIGNDGVSSMNSNPKHFYIEYSTHRNIEHPLKLITKCCDILIARFKTIFDDVKNIANSDKSYLSDLLTLETIDTKKVLKIKGEYWTVVNLIARYCYILTNGDIRFVSPALIHPEKEVGVINIAHNEFSSLIQGSIKAIISELETVKKAFI
jgi:hypothetical protein